MKGYQRALAGMAGGFVAVSSKILALDIAQLNAFLDHGHLAAAGDLRVTIYIFTPILIFLGGLMAWGSGESKPMTLISIGCAAPALVAPWTTGVLPDKAHEQFAFDPPAIISPAYAAEAANQSRVSGLQYLLGLKSTATLRYWVIAGSFLDLEKAKAYRDAINDADPSLEAFVGTRKPGNDYYPVILGGKDAFLPITEANALKDRAKEVDIIPGDLFLSNYAGRVDNPVVE